MSVDTVGDHDKSVRQMSSSDASDDTDGSEMQLAQLQEQLISTMIENQDLKAELVQFKEKNKVDSLLRDLELEREKNTQLCAQLRQQVEKVTQLIKSNLDVAQEATEDIMLETETLPPPVKPESKSWKSKLQDVIVGLYYDIVADFTTEPETKESSSTDGDHLAVKQLKDNIMRFKNGVAPVYHLGKGVHNLFTWKSPVYTLFTFMIYMYSVWYGWLLPVVLFLCIARLTINFLISRGWSINVRFLTWPVAEVDKDAVDPELALSDKFNLVLQVARQVQNILGELANGLEKIKNLLLWRQADASQHLFAMLCMAFVLSCVMSGVSLFRLMALYMGFKMFVVEYLYSRFPRIRQRYDSAYRIWKQLPTDAVLDDRYKRSLVDRHIIITTSGGTGDPSDTNDHSAAEITEEERSFCDVFSLPLSEKPLSDWEGGWRVSLVDKDKPILKALSRNGRLYLTNSFLCVERYKFQSPKNIMIPLADITHIEKAKPFAWLPGAGMSIEISVAGYEQPYTFGAIINRDDCFNRLVAHGVRLKLSWALEHEDVLPSSRSHSPAPGSTEASPAPSTAERTFRMSDLRSSVDDDTLIMLTS